MQKLFGAVIIGEDGQPFKAKVRDCNSEEEVAEVVKELYGEGKLFKVVEIDEEGNPI